MRKAARKATPLPTAHAPGAPKAHAQPPACLVYAHAEPAEIERRLKSCNPQLRYGHVPPPVLRKLGLVPRGTSNGLPRPL